MLGDVLRAVQAETATRPAEPRVTRIASMANLPLDRLREYLEDLVAAGLLAPPPGLALTAKGEEFLRRYLDWRETLERFGLGPSDPS